MKIYTKTVCPKCMLVKTTLDSANITYETVNLDENEEAKKYIIEKGFMAVPIMEHNGGLIADVPKMLQVIGEMAQ